MQWLGWRPRSALACLGTARWCPEQSAAAAPHCFCARGATLCVRVGGVADQEGPIAMWAQLIFRLMGVPGGLRSPCLMAWSGTEVDAPAAALGMRSYRARRSVAGLRGGRVTSWAYGHTCCYHVAVGPCGSCHEFSAMVASDTCRACTARAAASIVCLDKDTIEQAGGGRACGPCRSSVVVVQLRLCICSGTLPSARRTQRRLDAPSASQLLPAVLQWSMPFLLRVWAVCCG